ncbi:NADH-quinone oxidoreductase subunit NuoK [Buchnera aphidicola]|uniref:NADH-quinone oxidoreductase subunit K n=1 Tax=Buchnera aphidicola (Cinara laricifoliae) TaxID=2518977 RepID=A0A451DB18_9GAMM|nr:NADH-quinone oxidoreductase subunit NuoK [Buchnera aphidicola]VFP83592.1 NADH-quinone oxidoreductase subunit K [Buchnera aphidicola (Cinara laricifoliae)]
MLSLNHGIIVSILIFMIGLISLFKHKNLIFILISLELLTNAIALAMVLVGYYWNQTDGQIMYVFIITTAAAEVSVMLAFFLKIYQQYNTLDIFKLSEIYK